MFRVAIPREPLRPVSYQYAACPVCMRAHDDFPAEVEVEVRRRDDGRVEDVIPAAACVEGHAITGADREAVVVAARRADRADFGD